MRKNPEAKKKNRTSVSRPKNRYMRNAKLSEYKFLKILRGFSDNETAPTLAHSASISERTVRSTYKLLRRKLLEAAVSDRQLFGGSGLFLFRSGRLEAQGKNFIEGVVHSKIFANHIDRHAPRLRSMSDAQDLTFEVTIRIFCTLSMRYGDLLDYPPDTKIALGEMREMSTWLKAHLKTEGFLEKYGHIVLRFEKLTENMKILLEREELQALKTKSREHRFPDDLMYDDLRRHLLKCPI